MSLRGKIALVTGASRGIGRGIALQLGGAGATVYITARSPKPYHHKYPGLQETADEITERGGKGIPIYCDHSKMDEVQQLFKQIESETDGVLDILVNNAFSAIQALADVAGLSFWECDPELWDIVNNVGLRNHYYCSVYAARLMVSRKTGLIVNISSFGGLSYLFNVSYGVGKNAMDRMAADMAEELREHNVTIVSLWPGAVNTELFGQLLKEGKFRKIKNANALKAIDKESPEFVGKAVVALASDPDVKKKTGRVILTADIGLDYGFRDIDGREIGSIRSIKTILSAAHLSVAASYIPSTFRSITNLSSIAFYIPSWLRLPGWILTAVHSRL